MTPNPSSFLDFSPARKPLLGVLDFTFRATPDGREPHQPQTRGEARVVFEGAFSRQCSA
jgi:hypothetical protein